MPGVEPSPHVCIGDIVEVSQPSLWGCMGSTYGCHVCGGRQKQNQCAYKCPKKFWTSTVLLLCSVTTRTGSHEAGFHSRRQWWYRSGAPLFVNATNFFELFQPPHNAFSKRFRPELFWNSSEHTVSATHHTHATFWWPHAIFRATALASAISPTSLSLAHVHTYARSVHSAWIQLSGVLFLWKPLL